MVSGHSILLAQAPNTQLLLTITYWFLQCICWDFRCDRILWYGNGITQFSYFRGESRFSDHRPVCAVFAVDVRLIGSTSKRGFSRSSTKIEIDVEEILSPSRSYMALRNM